MKSWTDIPITAQPEVGIVIITVHLQTIPIIVTVARLTGTYSIENKITSDAVVLYTLIESLYLNFYGISEQILMFRVSFERPKPS